MSAKTNPKLVRDYIPKIIMASGKVCETEVLSDTDYMEKLNEKLVEEVQEYLESGSIEELADITEVIHAILAHKHTSMEDFETVRLEKLNSRGGFSKKLLLKRVGTKP